MTAILALSAAAIYGTADFCGGVASRRNSPTTVTVLAHVVGLLLLARGTYLANDEERSRQWR